MRARQIQKSFTFGNRIPWGLGLLLALTVVSSLLVAFTSRHATPLFALMALVPEAVWHGEVWRLVTWPFIQPGPFALIFTVVIFWWFGGDLAEEWGSRRFLSIFGGVMSVAAVGTCLIAQVDRSVLEQTYLGAWALTAALTVAWGFWFPERTVRVYFVLSITGVWLAYLTIAITVACSVYWGWEHLLPELLAEGSTVGWMYRRRILARLAPKRRAQSAVRTPARKAKPARKRPADVSYLRLVESDDKELPALPREVEDRVNALIAGQKKPDGE